jgi:AbrB family looped-hinge helix DNA binding protein
LTQTISYAIFYGMSITITLGKAGRLVVPKAIRDTLGLREGARLQLNVSSGGFEAVPEADNLQIRIKDGFPVILGGQPREKGEIVKAIKADREIFTDKMRSRRASK